MKVIIIGCTHAGTAAVKTIKKNNPQAKLTIYDKNDNISFLSCGIALYIEGVVKDKNGLFYSNKDELLNMGAEIKLKHEIIDINLKQKQVLVKDLETNKEFIDNFDKLVLALGSWPIIPQLEGIKSKNVLLSKNFNHANNIIKYIKNINKITIVGAGYIGIELAEALAVQGKKIVLIDAEKRIMPKYLDKEFTDIAEKTLKDHGIHLALNQKITGFDVEGELITKVHTEKSTFETEMLIMCIGFRPDTNLIKDKIKVSENGAILINEFMVTSHPDVYACGDCINSYYNPTKEPKYIPLATNAIRTGMIVGLNIKTPKFKYLGTQGTSGIKIYDWHIASTGLNENVAKKLGNNYDSVIIKDANRPEFMPKYDAVILKIIFDKISRKILGGQIISKTDLTEKINTLSVCIQKNMTVEELSLVDFFFQPHFNKPLSILNLAGLKALNIK
ncbi:NADH oxidase H2O2-forming [Candidatus Phytoplasma mali]|uniref:NADH oxidase H2O2-forming n=1 Tax=Phytoplasma mali (strain AT) TaxID=482235 RepID=B3QZT8_PHYMT|nr:FAD-dependent oxidoreductase [Candidatus Phytoplasma mali]CAP18475.1 NADH oxidase H2O2-forming [Candidatus Phytoplasma mali]